MSRKSNEGTPKDPAPSNEQSKSYLLGLLDRMYDSFVRDEETSHLDVQNRSKVFTGYQQIKDFLKGKMGED